MTHVAINAHLLSAQAGYRSAGIHGYIYHTLNALAPEKPDWRFTALVGAGNPIPHPNLTIERARFSTEHPLRRIVWEQGLQRGTLRRLQPDLYHAMAFVAPLPLRLPSVVTVHDCAFIRYPETLSRARRMYLEHLTRASCQQARVVIAVSQCTARDVETLLGIPPDKIVVVLSGVAEHFYPRSTAEVAAFRAVRGLPARFLLHVGTLEPRKNLSALLRAYAALPASLREAVHLVLAGGKGWDYATIFETVAAEKLASTVHFPGFVAGEDLPLWYSAAEALVMPSLYEGWGLPVVEAMACGCPTLVSDVSSLPEAAGETGLLLPSTDISAWTEGLRRAITDENWQAQSRTAGRLRARQFTWQATAQATLQAYQQALNPSPKSGS
ncbi:MAG: glycosyltransferase family 4 protein [Anaerolineae bacterium]|nr:glycosyltransferase family 4 protein [Anaerolineae bacterium]